MALLGPAAMLLSFDIEDAARTEHDHWHSHEHLPERLAIPGFLRGTRWAAAGGAVDGAPRYMVLYEVASLDTLTSDAYLQRLNNPTPWTQRMMAHYRGMRRGLCRVEWSEGRGQGGCALQLRLGCTPGRESALNAWLQGHVRHALPGQPGITSAALLRGAAAARMTTEQQIRGADAGVDWALVVTGYDASALEAARALLVGPQGLSAQGGCDLQAAVYRLQHAVQAQG